jgi:hypothetical protein
VSTQSVDSFRPLEMMKARASSDKLIPESVIDELKIKALKKNTNYLK